MNTLTLTEEGGRTTLTLRGGPHNATAEELATFEAAREGMGRGFAGTFAQLEAYLVRRRRQRSRPKKSEIVTLGRAPKRTGTPPAPGGAP